MMVGFCFYFPSYYTPIAQLAFPLIVAPSAFLVIAPSLGTPWSHLNPFAILLALHDPVI